MKHSKVRSVKYILPWYRHCWKSRHLRCQLSYIWRKEIKGQQLSVDKPLTDIDSQPIHKADAQTITIRRHMLECDALLELQTLRFSRSIFPTMEIDGPQEERMPCVPLVKLLKTMKNSPTVSHDSRSRLLPPKRHDNDTRTKRSTGTRYNLRENPTSQTFWVLWIHQSIDSFPTQKPISTRGERQQTESNAQRTSSESLNCTSVAEESSTASQNRSPETNKLPKSTSVSWCCGSRFQTRFENGRNTSKNCEIRK